MNRDHFDPQAEKLWTAEIERRAGEVVEGKVTLFDADEVHAEATGLLRAWAARRLPFRPQARTKS
jgi:hypothetical protein